MHVHELPNTMPSVIYIAVFLIIGVMHAPHFID